MYLWRRIEGYHGPGFVFGRTEAKDPEAVKALEFFKELHDIMELSKFAQRARWQPAVRIVDEVKVVESVRHKGT